MTKRILVTGAAGFIGSTFITQAVERGDTIVALDALTYAGHKENIAHLDGKKNFHFVKGNIGDADTVAALLHTHAIDSVINFAAESHVDNSIHAPAVFIETNILGVYTLLETCRAYWKELKSEQRDAFRFIQVSTDEVYGSLGDTEKFTENSPMRPNSPYSASKAAGDHLARAWFKTYKLPVITTNCSNNYGPRQHPEKLIPHMITRCLEQKSLPVYGDGKQIRDWIHVEDHCRGVYLALTQGTPGETYCFGGNAERKNIELVIALCGLLDELRPAEDGQPYAQLMKFVADRAGHDRRYAIDDSKAVKELGFTRGYNLDYGLRQTVKWYLDNADWCTTVLTD